ncbi:MAG: ATP-binding protein [Alphaproteobacteria bacterium]
MGSDLTDCDREPIHIPGSIQPQGALFVVAPADGRVLQAAIGPGACGIIAGDPVGHLLDGLLPPAASPMLSLLDSRLPAHGSIHLGTFAGDGGSFHVVAHRSDGAIVVELESAAGQEPGSFDEVYPHVREFLERLHQTADTETLAKVAARQIRRITDLDRALVYRFDEAWNGEVIAEDRNDNLPSYLGLRFPASDIPAQARKLYHLNRLRLIADATYTPVPIAPALNPATGRPIDLSLAVLRSVSPVHLEYMRNMGTMASMSISLLRNGRLWGLISCHNRAPARVPYHVRTACDFIGQVLSLQIAATESSAIAERRNTLRNVQTRLLAHMAGAEHFLDGLVSHPGDLLALTDADGAAVVAGGHCTRIGEAPPDAEILRLVEWLAAERHGDVFVTDSLASRRPDGVAIKDRASGVLAISISQLYDSYVLWFRPEAVRTVEWGGDPRKGPDSHAAGLRLHPRKSFAAWQELVQLHSRPWHSAEVDAASELRTAVVDIVLRRAEEMAALSERLVSINKELEAFSYSVSHDLRAPFRHIVGYAQLLRKFEGKSLTERGQRYIDTIVESAISAGTLVDDLLSFSQMGRSALRPTAVDMDLLVAETRKRMEMHAARPELRWRIEPLPKVQADPSMLQLVVQNLLENAMKFTRGRDPALIEVECLPDAREHIIRVRDNGAGFDMAYVGKLFGVFQRLHRVEEFEGTGIGLANVKRIVERHGGRVWAEGKVNGGASFHFALPKETTR